MGIAEEPLHSVVLLELQKDNYNKIDERSVKICLQANRNNALTSYYFLQKKKMV